MEKVETQPEFKELPDIEIKPHNDHVLVNVQKDDAYCLQGMILMPTESGPNKKIAFGTVVEVGPGIHYKDLERPVDVKVGQQVVFAMHIGYPIPMGKNGEHILIKNNDILGTVTVVDTKES